MPGIGEYPVLRFAVATQHLQQEEDDRDVADDEGDLERKDRFVNRGDGAEEKLRAGGIGARDFRIIQAASLRGVQASERWIRRNDFVRVVAEPLHSSVPQISMNVVVRAGRGEQERTLPDGSQGETNQNDVSRIWRRVKKLADGEEVRDSGNQQRNEG